MNIFYYMETIDKISFEYEAFICKAHDCQRSNKNGAHDSFMRNLITAENGGYAPKPVAKQFEIVKGYIDKALKKIEPKISTENKTVVSTLKQDLEYSQSSTHLALITQKGLDLMEEEGFF